MKDGGKQKARRKTEKGTFLTVPVLMTVIDCPACGAEIECWVNDRESGCPRCAYRVVQRSEQEH